MDNLVVSQLARWWDDEVFERFPTWFDCINSVDQAAFFSGLDLERFFGKQDENGIGNYAQCVKYGIGREVIVLALTLYSSARRSWVLMELSF